MPDPEKQSWLYHETGEASYRASQFMAMEGQTFVLVASQIMTEENLEKNNCVGNHVTKTVSAADLSHRRGLTFASLVVDFP
jgi:nitrilase